MDLFQISHDGALYVQRHGFAKSGDKQGFVRPEMHEEQLAVYACATTEVMRHQSDPTLLKDHEKFNWSTLVKCACCIHTLETAFLLIDAV